MAIAISLVIVGVVIILIWLIVEFKRFRHKLLALFLIVVVLSLYISFTMALKNRDIDFASVSGVKEAFGIYFSWLGTVSQNFKSITSKAVEMDWGTNNETKR